MQFSAEEKLMYGAMKAIHDSEKNKEKLARSLTDEQISFINNGGIKLLSTHNNSDYINFELQQATLNIVKDIIDSNKFS